MRLKPRWLAMVLGLLACAGCNYSLKEQDDRSFNYAIRRFSRMDMEIAKCFDQMERDENFPIAKTKLGTSFKSSCFSRANAEGLSAALVNETSQIFRDPHTDADAAFKNASFSNYLALVEPKWKEFHDHNEVHLSRDTAFRSGISRPLYDQAVAYYGIVDSALLDIRTNHAQLKTAITMPGPDDLLSLRGIVAFLGLLILIRFVRNRLVERSEERGRHSIPPRVDPKEQEGAIRFQAFELHLASVALMEEEIAAHLAAGDQVLACRQIERWLDLTQHRAQELDSFIPGINPKQYRKLMNQLDGALKRLRHQQTLLGGPGPLPGDQEEPPRPKQHGSRQQQHSSRQERSQKIAAKPITSKVQVALNLLDIDPDELPDLNEKALTARFKQILRNIHPDVAGTNDEQRAYFQKQTAHLNQARADLLAWLRTK